MQMEWVKVTDRLPSTKPAYTDGPLQSETVLTFNGTFVSVGKYEQTFKTRKFRWEDRTFGTRYEVTHWMPLPDKPE